MDAVLSRTRSSGRFGCRRGRQVGRLSHDRERNVCSAHGASRARPARGTRARPLAPWRLLRAGSRAPPHAGRAAGALAGRVRRCRCGHPGGRPLPTAAGATRPDEEPRRRAGGDGEAAAGLRAQRAERPVRAPGAAAGRGAPAARAARRDRGVRVQPRRRPDRERRDARRSLGEDVRLVPGQARRARAPGRGAVQPAHRLSATRPRQAASRRGSRLPRQPRDQPARRPCRRPPGRRDGARARQPEEGALRGADREAQADRVRGCPGVPRDRPRRAPPLRRRLGEREHGDGARTRAAGAPDRRHGRRERHRGRPPAPSAGTRHPAGRGSPPRRAAP